MFEERYTKMNEGIHPGDEVIRQTLAAGKPRTHYSPRLRPWTAVALCLLLALLTGTAVAVTVEYDFSSLLKYWFPLSAKDFTPLNLSDTEQGVTMTVLQGNLTRDGKIELIVAFSGEGVNENARPDLGHAAPAQIFGDMTQATVTPDDAPYPLILRLVTTPEEPITAEDVAAIRDSHFILYMTRIHLGSRTIRETHGLTLSSVPQAGIQQVQGNSDSTSFHPNKKYDLTCLVPGEPIIELPCSMAVTAMGYLPDGQLAIQTRKPISLNAGTSCGAWLVPRKRALATPVLTDFRRWLDEENGWVYTEYLYNIPAQRLHSYQLETTCMIADETLEGDWAVAIDLNSLLPATE